MGHFTQVSFFKRGCQPSCAVGARQRSLTQWAGEVEVIGFQPSLQQHRVALGVVTIGISHVTLAWHLHHVCHLPSDFNFWTKSQASLSNKQLWQIWQLWVRSPMNHGKYHGFHTLSHPNICGWWTWWTHRIPMPLSGRHRWPWEDLSVPTVVGSERTLTHGSNWFQMIQCPYTLTQQPWHKMRNTQKKNKLFIVWKFWSKPIWW